MAAGGSSQLDGAIHGLKKLLIDEKGARLEEVAVEKILRVTSELEEMRLGGLVEPPMLLRPPHPLPPALPPIERIKWGFLDFRVNHFEKYPWIYDRLAQGQQPKFLVFACSDSRVSPTFILNFIPGDAFMARNIANLVPSFDLDKTKNSGVGAIIEYAVTALGVENILVIGHSLCGGIQRLMTLDGATTSYDFIDDWVKIATPAKEFVNQHFPNQTQEERNKLCEKEAVKLSLKNLKSYPYVRDGVENGSLNLMGGYYDFVNGDFMLWPMDSDQPPIIIPPPSQTTQ